MANFREIIYAGKNLRSFGFYLKKGNAIVDFALNNIETKNIQGSLVGDVLVGDRSRQNFDKTYDFKTFPNEIPYTEKKFIKVVTDWLNDNTGYYQSLEDTAKEGYIKYAVLKSVNNFKKSYDGCFELSLTFSCQPFWYRKSGKETIEKTVIGNSSTTFTIINPEKFIAYPYIEVISSTTGSAGGFTLAVNNELINVSSSTGRITIDSEKMKIYPSENAAGINLPFFVPNKNQITFQGNSASTTYNISIIPNWRVY